MRIPVYILAGGQSRRFGSDKARAVLHGVPLIARLAGQSASFANETVVVADRPDKYQDLGLSTIADLLPGQGPLGGLQTALADAIGRGNSAWTLLASCDLTIVQEAWVTSLMTRMDENCRACAFRGDFWYPFPGIYHTDLLPIVNEYLASAKASFQHLLSDHRARAIALPLPPDWPAMGQVNTREDLERLSADI